MFSKIAVRQFAATRVAVRAFSTAPDAAIQDRLAKYDQYCIENKVPIVTAFPNDILNAKEHSNFLGVSPMGQLVFSKKSKGLCGTYRVMGKKFDNVLRDSAFLQALFFLVKWITLGFFVPYALANVTHPHLFTEEYMKLRTGTN